MTKDENVRLEEKNKSEEEEISKIIRSMINFKDHIESIPDFPKEGILYRDIQPLLSAPEVFKKAVLELGKLVEVPDYWVAIESRGFLFASALSLTYGGGIKLIRKQGKLLKFQIFGNL